MVLLKSQHVHVPEGKARRPTLLCLRQRFRAIPPRATGDLPGARQNDLFPLMILTSYHGVLGDRLFQYSFARILAARFRYQLQATPIPGFPGTFVDINGENVLGPTALWEGQWPVDARDGRPLTREELQVPPGARVTIRGRFQRFELYSDTRDEIRSDWLRIERTASSRSRSDFAIWIGLPDADGSVFHEEELRRLIQVVHHDRLFFLTNQPCHPLIAALADLRATVVSDHDIGLTRFIWSFKRIAICQNATAWWAAFLSDAREVYFPHCNRGAWSHPQLAQLPNEPEYYGIDLRVYEDRYIYDW